MFGLGKDRSALGKFLDSNDISQEELSEMTGIPRQTISYLCKGSNYANPQEGTRRKIVNALRREGYDVEFADLGW
jgi:transcriptional regulator with XRE-family HTH domain